VIVVRHNINALNESNEKDLLNVVKPADGIFAAIEKCVDINQRTEGFTIKAVDEWIERKRKK